MKSPNDLKLSDRRGWRDRCVAGERRRQEAAGVTAAPVRCSAWLGVAVAWLGVMESGWSRVDADCHRDWHRRRSMHLRSVVPSRHRDSLRWDSACWGWTCER